MSRFKTKRWQSEWIYLAFAFVASTHAQVRRVQNGLCETRRWLVGDAGPIESSSVSSMTPTLEIRWMPDSAVFREAFNTDGRPLWLAKAHRDAIRTHCRDLAALKAGVHVVWQDDVAGTAETFVCPNGIADWLRERFPDAAIQQATGEFGGIAIDAAWTWTEHDDLRPRIQSFANGREMTIGTHVTGALSALSRRATANRRKSGLAPLPAAQRHRGLVLAISAWLDNPTFGSPTGDRLCTIEAESAAFRVVYRATAPGGAASVTML